MIQSTKFFDKIKKWLEIPILFCGTAPDQLCILDGNPIFRDWAKCAEGCMATRKWLDCTYSYLELSNYSSATLLKVVDYISKTLYVQQAWDSFWTCGHAHEGQRQVDVVKGFIEDHQEGIKTFGPMVAVTGFFTLVFSGIGAYQVYRYYQASRA